MLISIIIPTRDRAEYLKHSIQTALSIPDHDIEIIISDNASIDGTKDILEALNDKRLKYVNTGKRVSMRANFEFALKASSGDYVIFFGDDDGIIPNQFKHLRYILEEHTPDSLSWDFLTYVWPIEGYGKKTGGLRFEFRKIYGNILRSNPKVYLETLLNAELQRDNYLPRIYHGCMSRKFLNTLVNKKGMYFCSRSPDLHMSFRASQKGGEFLRINHPFTINGMSPASTGGGSRSIDTNNKSLSKSFEYKSETEMDPIKDVLPLTKSMGFSFLSAIETLRYHFPNPPMKINYFRWYVFCLEAIPKMDITNAKEITDIIRSYAQKTSTETEFNKANSKYYYYKIKWSKLKEKIIHKPFSFRVKAKLDKKNNILTATQTADIILGQDLEFVLKGKKSQRSCIRLANKRKQKLIQV